VPDPGALSTAARDRALDERPAFDPSLPVPIIGSTTVHAGDRVVVQWAPSGPEVEELELLVSIDGGRHFPLRISPELPGGQDRYVWCVPNLGANQACIRLRVRLGEREIEGPPGAPFCIRSDPARPREPWLFCESGWWGEDLGARAAGAAGLSAPSRGPSFRADGSGAALVAPGRIAVSAQAPGFGPRSLRRPIGQSCSSTTSYDERSRSYPMRE
jgi:hypothetical protein